ncbi:MAG TPA: hypothetical protein VFJ96_10510, partial [Gemmatimonadaceae bacterium]|nr:hypothetical protein [Gemmatimonadaceae bacterium]
MTSSSARRAWIRTSADLLLLAVLECLWCWPLPFEWRRAIPGRGAGDNLSFLWNFWWTRKALATPGLHVLETRWLFFPLHVDLTLNTHTVLDAFVGATLLAPLSTIGALNLTVLAGLVLGAAGAYALARDLTGSRRAAILAGVIFGQCPFLAAHLLGHFNLTSPWVLPWFLFAFGRAIDRRSTLAALGAGLCLAATAYTDDYYLVFLIVAASVWLLLQVCEVRAWVERRGAAPGRVRAMRIFGVLLAIDLVLIAMVLVTGGGAWHIDGVAISMTSTFNLREIAWMLAICLALTTWRLRLVWRRTMAGSGLIRVTAITAAMFCAAVAPLGLHAAGLFATGDYVSQAYSWKSAPSGVDLLALVAGNPFHPLWGRWSAMFHHRLGLSLVEGVAWLGVVPAILGWIGWRRGGAAKPRRLRWPALLAIFFVWSLGPFLRVAGVNTGLVLPETLLRFVPIAANARIPGRAMVMVYLALAMFAAIGLATLRGRWSHPGWQWLAIGIVAFGYLRAPLPMYRPRPSSISTALASSPVPGAVVDLPLGLADGFADRGGFDRRNLSLQTLHERPIAGGFIARLSPRVLDAYARLPVLGAWWR